MLKRVLALVFITSTVVADNCEFNRIPYGVEVHRNGHVSMLCSKPNCHDKKYAECPERPNSRGCPLNNTWVGGVDVTVDGKLSVRCCQYDLLEKYGEVLYEKVLVRPGEYFEGEEKVDKDEDVTSYDLISDIRQGSDEKGKYYALKIVRYFCEKEPDVDPAWKPKNAWPYIDELKVPEEQ